MTYSKKERIRIHLRAKRKVGLVHKDDAGDKFTFMQQCIDSLGGDETDVEQICEMMWEQGDDDFFD